MPWKLEKAEGGYYVTNIETGKRMSKKPLSKGRAASQLQTLYSNVPEASKEVSGTPTGVPAHGPGGLFSTPGLGGGIVKIGKFQEPKEEKPLKKRWGKRTKGGQGSGNFGHSGIPGHHGGSRSGSGISASSSKREEHGVNIAYEQIGDSLKKKSILSRIRLGEVTNEGMALSEVDSSFPIIDVIKNWCSSLPVGSLETFDEIVIGQSNRDFDRMIGEKNSGLIFGFYRKDTDGKSRLYFRPTRIIFGDDPTYFYHEVGHAIYRSSTTASYWNDAYSNKKFDRFTDYSKKNKEEGFCETFKSFVRTKGHVSSGKSKVDPIMDDLAEAYGKVFEVINGMPRTKKELSLKGGQGSGNFGHSGIRGHHGGSVSRSGASAMMTFSSPLIKTGKTINELMKQGITNRRHGISYFIMRDGTLVASPHPDVTHEGIAGTIQKERPDLLPSTVDPHQDGITYLINHGAFRVILMSDHAYMEIETLDDKVWKRIKNAYWDGKFGSIKKIHIAPRDQKKMTTVTEEELKNGERVEIEMGRQVIKERLKGGSGSGNFGHRGIVGHRGGSSSAGGVSAGGSDSLTQGERNLITKYGGDTWVIEKYPEKAKQYIKLLKDVSEANDYMDVFDMTDFDLDQETSDYVKSASDESFGHIVAAMDRLNNFEKDLHAEHMSGKKKIESVVRVEAKPVPKAEPVRKPISQKLSKRHHRAAENRMRYGVGMMRKEVTEKGGPGSGGFGHTGVKGRWGGSKPGTAGIVAKVPQLSYTGAKRKRKLGGPHRTKPKMRSEDKVVQNTKEYDDARKVIFETLKGGSGSGNFGHAGVRGHRGGSAPSSGVSAGIIIDSREVPFIKANQRIGQFGRDNTGKLLLGAGALAVGGGIALAKLLSSRGKKAPAVKKTQVNKPKAIPQIKKRKVTKPKSHKPSFLDKVGYLTERTMTLRGEQALADSGYNVSASSRAKRAQQTSDRWSKKEYFSGLKNYVEESLKGGPGSGNFNHLGRKGEVGGSVSAHTGIGILFKKTGMMRAARTVGGHAWGHLSRGFSESLEQKYGIKPSEVGEKLDRNFKKSLQQKYGVTPSEAKVKLTDAATKAQELINTYMYGIPRLSTSKKEYEFKDDDMGCVVFKDKFTGKYRWVTFSSNSFKDRDGEIVSLKALMDDVERADKTGDYGTLRWWHVSEPSLDIGDCDFNMLHGKILIESGTFRNEALGARIKNKAGKLQVSVGFHHPMSEPDSEGVFYNIRRFERSLLPAGIASNLLTKFVVSKGV